VQCQPATPRGPSAVTFAALAVKGQRLAWDLAAYKSSPDERSRDLATALLTGLADGWLRRHESCLASAAGAADGFHYVTVVPSRRQRAERRLVRLAKAAPASRGRYVDVLKPNDRLRDAPHHTPESELFEADASVRDYSVLLIEDTWATGANAQSAACALRSAGAETVGIFALGRHMRPAPGGCVDPLVARYLQRAQQQPWSWDACALCAPSTASRAA
jgi:hypothetical protein